MVKTFEEFINEELLNEEVEQSDFPEEVPSDMPEEFTGDPKTDPYLAAAIYKNDNEKIYNNKNFDGSLDFYPYKKAQVQGNKYNDIWMSLVHWIQGKTDSSLQGLTVVEKDRVLLSTFKSILDSQKNLYHTSDLKGYTSKLLKGTSNWKAYNYNRCKEKWEKYTEMAKKVYPGKGNEFKRSQFRKERYVNFIRKEGIEKYAKGWIPEFSRTYPMD